MPVSRKPKIEELDLEKFIQGGGSEPPGKSDPREKKIQPIKVRIPADLLVLIDALVAARKPSPSRHQWILEALYEKVERDKE